MRDLSPFIAKLRTELGPGKVLDSPTDRLLYSYDAALDKSLPSAVVLPVSAEEVAKAVRLARAAGVPFVARGAGTNLCGGSIPPPMPQPSAVMIVRISWFVSTFSSRAFSTLRILPLIGRIA